MGWGFDSLRGRKRVRLCPSEAEAEGEGGFPQYIGGCSLAVKHQFVELRTAGSNPVSHPKENGASQKSEKR